MVVVRTHVWGVDKVCMVGIDKMVVGFMAIPIYS